MKRAFLVFAVLLAAAAVTAGGDDETRLKVGAAAPAWVALPGVDGKKHSLADLQGKDVVVVVFTCNSCPIAEAYENRLIAFHKKYCGPQSKVALVAINVNVIPEDRLPKMQERAQEKGFAFPYLHDETQKIARDYGAIYTPEFFVLGKDRKLVYSGAMDDDINEKDAKTSHLELAVDAALKGEQAKVSETPGRGCLIRYVRKRE